MSEEKNEEIRRGGIRVETEHIFPIIKKWLYSDKDIFLREIVSNASDAVTKLKRLDALRELELPENEDLRIDVTIDKDAGTLTVTDNGIGMTEEELEKYICSIALSGALDFITKYENESGDNGAANGIIGHFGLGFYSSFMVSDRVEIDTLSCRGGKAVHWSCEEAGDYEISESDRTERGTSVIMHITDDEKEYLDPFRIRGILDKYCSFMPVPVFFDDGTADDSDADEKKDGTEKEIKPINDTLPLWSRPQSEITEEEYNKFYHKLFNDIDDPLFYIHINADYPLNFRGILYFPKIRSETQSLEGEVKLYYNQVFVADNIKEVLPDYLLMLRGALDCPELPLNVSRSYLQDNQYVKRIAQFIVKKVGDRLNGLFNTDREKYEKVYNDIRIFIEYACIRDRKFYDRIKDSIVLKLTDGTFNTIDEYLRTNANEAPEAAEAPSESDNGDTSVKKDSESLKGTVYYATDTALQTQYIRMLGDSGKKVAVFDLMLDSQYITSLEEYREGLKFTRVDSDISEALEKDEDTKTPESLEKLFRKVTGNDKLEVKCEKMKTPEVPAVLLVSEQSRRFEEMMKLYTMPGQDAPTFPIDYTLSLNKASKVYGRLLELADEDSDKAEEYASFIYKLALLAQKKLTADELNDFLGASYRIINKL